MSGGRGSRVLWGAKAIEVGTGQPPTASKKLGAANSRLRRMDIQHAKERN